MALELQQEASLAEFAAGSLLLNVHTVGMATFPQWLVSGWIAGVLFCSWGLRTALAVLNPRFIDSFAPTTERLCGGSFYG